MEPPKGASSLKYCSLSFPVCSFRCQRPVSPDVLGRLLFEVGVLRRRRFQAVYLVMAMACAARKAYALVPTLLPWKCRISLPLPHGCLCLIRFSR